MASFISVLSLLILVLASGYFSLPVMNEFINPPLYEDLTTEKAVHLRLVSDDETTEFPTIQNRGESGEHMGFEMSTFDNGLSAENIFRASRMFDERVTSEPWTFTTEKSPIEERAFNDLLLTTAEPITETVEHERRSFKGEIEPEDDATDASEVDTDKRGNPIETTTTSSTSTSTKKYTGLLKDDNEREFDSEKPVKTLNKVPTKSKTQVDDTSNETIKSKSPKKSKLSSQEDPEDSSAPMLIYDQRPSKDVGIFPNGDMILDENHDAAVTDRTLKISTSDSEKKKEQKPLNQGKKSSDSEEKKSDN
jgi:hypothetical protein